MLGVAILVVGMPFGVGQVEVNRWASQLVECRPCLVAGMPVEDAEGVGRIVVGLVAVRIDQVAVGRNLVEHTVAVGRMHVGRALVVIGDGHIAVLEEHKVVVGLECQ